MRATGQRKLLAVGYPQVRMLVLVTATGVVFGLVASETLAQSSAVLSVTARIIAACTTTTANPQSSCSEEILALQSNVTNASARISTTGNETVITHKGGLPPKIETQENQISVNF
jgi:hypothetical protein